MRCVWECVCFCVSAIAVPQVEIIIGQPPHSFQPIRYDSDCNHCYCWNGAYSHRLGGSPESNVVIINKFHIYGHVSACGRRERVSFKLPLTQFFFARPPGKSINGKLSPRVCFCVHTCVSLSVCVCVRKVPTCVYYAYTYNHAHSNTHWI